MHAHAFDIAARRLAVARDRRQALRVIAGGLTGALLAAGRQQRASALDCSDDGNSCENQPCYPGLVCSTDLACLIPGGS
jgi:hypothetical protein